MKKFFVLKLLLICNVSADILNKDLSLISKWAYDWMENAF